jgi:hypothetical protein
MLRLRSRVPTVVGPSAPIVVGPSIVVSAPPCAGDGRGYSDAIVVTPAPPPVVVVPGEVIAIGPSAVVRVKPRGAIAIGPAAVVTVKPRPVVAVEAPPRAAWEEKGWVARRRGNHVEYEGEYRVTPRNGRKRDAYRGRIVVTGNRPVAFIAGPPRDIHGHPKGVCFRHLNNGWFRLEWARPATNVDDAILYVERILDESVNRR